MTLFKGGLEKPRKENNGSLEQSTQNLTQAQIVILWTYCAMFRQEEDDQVDGLSYSDNGHTIGRSER